MSLPADIAEKLGQYVVNFFTYLKANVQTMYPGLLPEEQEKQVFLQTTNIHTTCVMRSGLNMCGTVTPHQSMIQACLFKFDLTLTKDNFSISELVNMGKINGTNWQHLRQDEIEYVENELIVPWTTTEHYSVNKLQSGVLSAKVSTSANNRITLGVYDSNNIYHADWVNQTFLTTWGTTWQSGNYLDIAYNVVEYTASGGYVTVTFSESGWDINNLYPNSSTIFGLKSYPFVGNFKDQSFINNYITNNGATNNYHRTYTTPDNKNIEVYYGDNYIIYYTEDDEPVSYDDVKNAFNIAINQINDDNDTDIPSAPPFVPPPPPPPPEDDDIEDQTIGAGANLASIARLWLLTREQLQDLHAAFTSAPANYDPLSSFIGVLGFGVQPIKVVGDSLPWTLNPINIRMTNGETWHTGVEAHIVDSQVSAFSFPDIHIQKKYNNFLDYSPYATHEIFIPMCGWLTLPDIAVDRTISVTYLPDLESMKCRAIVAVVDEDGDRCVIGVKDGIMGAEVPFSNLNHSVWLANLITNAADVAGEVVTGAIGAGFTKTNAKGGTYRPYEGFTIGMAGTLPGAVGNALLSGNVNRTHVVGSNGNRTGFSDGECIMIKSTYHKIDKPDNYDHTIGKVCNKTGQLSEFHGFTVCDNPHINISALDAEKEEIKRLLEEGVILPSGE